MLFISNCKVKPVTSGFFHFVFQEKNFQSCSEQGEPDRKSLSFLLKAYFKTIIGLKPCVYLAIYEGSSHFILF